MLLGLIRWMQTSPTQSIILLKRSVQLSSTLAKLLKERPAQQRLFVSMQTASGDAFWKVQTPVEAKSWVFRNTQSPICYTFVLIVTSKQLRNSI